MTLRLMRLLCRWVTRLPWAPRNASGGVGLWILFLQEKATALEKEMTNLCKVHLKLPFWIQLDQTWPWYTFCETDSVGMVPSDVQAHHGDFPARSPTAWGWNMGGHAVSLPLPQAAWGGSLGGYMMLHHWFVSWCLPQPIPKSQAWSPSMFWGFIDPSWPLEKVDRFIRALFFPPHSGARVRLEDGSIHSVFDLQQFQALREGRSGSSGPFWEAEPTVQQRAQMKQYATWNLLISPWGLFFGTTGRNQVGAEWWFGLVVWCFGNLAVSDFFFEIKKIYPYYCKTASNNSKPKHVVINLFSSAKNLCFFFLTMIVSNEKV